MTISRHVAALVFLLPGVAPAETSCRTANPAHRIGPEEAKALYDCVEPEIVAAYAAVEGVPGVPDYRMWPRVSTAPFRSITHGRMFISHMVSPEAEALYTSWEKMRGKALPIGTILAKESFRIAGDGSVNAGPLFLMEKVTEADAPETDGWIYTEVLPDGRFDRTGAKGHSRMMWCHDCHTAVTHQDGVFFPPRKYRAE